MTHKSRSCKEEKIMSSRGAKTRTSDLPFLRYSSTDLKRTSWCARSIANVYMISVQLSPEISRVYSVMAWKRFKSKLKLNYSRNWSALIMVVKLVHLLFTAKILHSSSKLCWKLSTSNHVSLPVMAKSLALILLSLRWPCKDGLEFAPVRCLLIPQKAVTG